MVAHQLDLFGSPLKPPKRIKVDDDIPTEEVQEKIMTGSMENGEPVNETMAATEPATENLQLHADAEEGAEMHAFNLDGMDTLEEQSEVPVTETATSKEIIENEEPESNIDWEEQRENVLNKNDQETETSSVHVEHPSFDNANTEISTATGQVDEEVPAPAEEIIENETVITDDEEPQSAEMEEDTEAEEQMAEGNAAPGTADADDDFSSPEIETVEIAASADETPAQILETENEESPESENEQASFNNEEETVTPVELTTTDSKKETAEAEYANGILKVPADEDLFKRQYYNMRETAAMFGVNQSLLRFWENEFDILKPKKNKKGDRYFRPIDVKNLVLIYHLLRVRKFTLEGAKDYLQKNKNAGDRFELINRLEKLKSFLLELKAIF